MRSFSKKLAFVLAAAMVFTSFAPAAKAEAAKEMVINKSSQILYVTDGDGINDAAQVGGGKGNVSEYDFYVKNKPSDWKKTLKFEWSSSDEDVATVNQSGLTAAVGVGKANITVKVTDKATGKEVATSKVKVTVKANAAQVEIKDASKISGSVLELKDGKAELNLDRYMYDADGNKTSKRGTLVTDYTEWFAEPATGVEITQSNGNYTFTEPGEYKLYCRTYQSSKYTKTTAESDPVVVTVVDKTFEVKQTTSKKFELKFAQAANISAADVTVTQVINNVLGGVEKIDYKVRNVEMSDDKTTAKVDVFFDFAHEGVYTVAVKGYETTTFNASVGQPVKMLVYLQYNPVNNRYVTVGTNATLDRILYDANNVDVTDKFDADRNKVDYTIKYSDSYELAGDSLYFDEVGAYATVNATYHPGLEYNEFGEEIGIVKAAATTFYAVAQGQAKITGVHSWGVSTSGNAGWNDPKDVKLGDPLKKLWVKLNTSAGGDPILVNNYDQAIYVGDTFIGYANFTATNPDILGIYETPTVDLYPRKVGTGPVVLSIVNNIDGKDVEQIVASFPIKVDAKRVMTTVGYKEKTKMVHANPADGMNSQKVADPWIELQAFDQYGNPYTSNAWWDGTPLYESYGLKGINKVSQKAVTAEAVEIAGNGISVDSSKFYDILLAMAGELDADATQPLGSASFGFEVKVKDTETKAVKTITFSINARSHIGDTDHSKEHGHSLELVLGSKDNDLATNGNNIARLGNYTGDGNNDHLNNIKQLVFDVYEICNRAYYDEVPFDVLPSDKADIASGTYYYRVFRNGKDVTAEALNDGVLKTTDNNDTTKGSGTTLTYDLTGETTSDYADASRQNKKIVAYTNANETIGAATYNIALYYAKKDGEASRISNKSVTVKLDAGSYKLTFRDKAVAGSTDWKDLLQCFYIANRNGENFLHNEWYDSSRVTNSTVKFNNNQTVEYAIVRNYDMEAQRAGDDVFVEKIVFWEEVGTAAGGEKLYAEYVVPVGYFVEIAK